LPWSASESASSISSRELGESIARWKYNYKTCNTQQYITLLYTFLYSLS
jgi:hypothetical protein